MANPSPIRVAVHGAAGRVGREVLRAVAEAPGMELVAAIDQLPLDGIAPLPTEAPYHTSVSEALADTHPQVIVDFTNAKATMALAPIALASGARLVIGSTGFREEQIAALGALCDEHGMSGVYAPNFALGAVVLTKLAAMAARFFDYADVAEEHHETKLDAPSGTAMAIAKAIREASADGYRRPMPEREPLEGTRGGDYDGITMHSSRMPGRMAHHQVTFGAPGQTLTLRHDTINRECYMPGVLLAVRQVRGLSGLTVGLDKLLDI